MKSKFKVEFANLISPDGFWPWPYSIEQAFGIFEWMVETGERYPPVHGRWVDCGVTELLGTQPTCGYSGSTQKVHSCADLRKRFHWAVLSRYTNSCTEKWRADNNITPMGVKIIHFAHEDAPKVSCDRVDKLLLNSGTLTTQLNEFYAQAVEIYGVKVLVHETYGFRFVLRYGFDGSSWDHDLARAVKGEGFESAFIRAETKLQELTKKGNATNDTSSR